MKEWFENLQPREQLIILVGAVICVIVLLWAIIWNPITTKTTALRESVSDQRELLTWMQDSSARIQALEGSNTGGAPVNTSVTLINAVESTSKRNGLRNAITNMKPDGDSKINLDIKGAKFDDMIVWQGQLTKQYGIRAEQFSAKATDQPGLVDARITLTR